MSRLSDRIFWKWLHEHPWLAATTTLVWGLINAYEALYAQVDDPLRFFYQTFALASFAIFVALLLDAIVDYFCSRNK